MTNAILIVDDDPKMLRFLAANLRNSGFEVATAGTAREAILKAELDPPLLVVLDLSLPDFDGIDVLRSLREWMLAPIVIVSSFGDEELKVTALDLGADDYITKPFSMPELLARLRVALRRAGQSQIHETPMLTVGPLSIDQQHHQLFVNGQEVLLTRTEYALLHCLAMNAGKTMTQSQLVELVWGNAEMITEASLRTFIKQIRRKIEPDSAQPRLLVNIAGIGYRLVKP